MPYHLCYFELNHYIWQPLKAAGCASESNAAAFAHGRQIADQFMVCFVAVTLQVGLPSNKGRTKFEIQPFLWYLRNTQRLQLNHGIRNLPTTEHYHLYG